MAVTENFEQLKRVGGHMQPIVGAAIASTTSIQPTFAITPISGTEVVKYITPPYASFQGQLVFIPGDAFTTSVTTGTSGNIAKAVTAVAGSRHRSLRRRTWYLKV